MALKFVTSLDATGFLSGIARMEKATKEFNDSTTGKFAAGVARGSAVAGAALGAATYGLINWGSQLRDSIDSTDMSAESFQRLAFAFGQSGTKQEAFTRGAQSLTVKMAEAREGNAKTIRSFADLGITVADLDKGTAEVLGMIADGTRNAADPSASMAASLSLLGRSGKEMQAGLKEGADGLRELGSAIKALSNEDLRNLDAAGDKLTHLKNKAMAFGATQFNKVADAIGSITMGDVMTQLANLGGLMTGQKFDYAGPDALGAGTDAEINARRESNAKIKAEKAKQAAAVETAELQIQFTEDQKEQNEKLARDEIQNINDVKKAREDFDSYLEEQRKYSAAGDKKIWEDAIKGEEERAEAEMTYAQEQTELDADMLRINNDGNRDKQRDMETIRESMNKFAADVAENAREERADRLRILAVRLDELQAAKEANQKKLDQWNENAAGQVAMGVDGRRDFKRQQRDAEAQDRRVARAVERLRDPSKRATDNIVNGKMMKERDAIQKEVGLNAKAIADLTNAIGQLIVKP